MDYKMRRICNYCDGTGYGSAARNSGNPNMIGIWKCDYCGGEGYHEPYVCTPEEAEKLRIHIGRMMKRINKKKGIN